MRYKLVFWIDLLVAVKDVAFLVTADKELLVVAPNHSLNSVLVHLAAILIL
jgi:hypothetical protein